MSINESDKPAEVAVKPPLGLTPRWVATNLRVRDIVEAMHRYELAGKLIPREWQNELDELTGEVPLKERPDFITGYREGLADRRRIVEQEESERPATPPAPEASWVEFIRELGRIQIVAQREGSGPRFDLVTAARAMVFPVVEEIAKAACEVTSACFTASDIQRLIEALDFCIGNSDYRANSANHNALLQRLKRLKADLIPATPPAPLADLVAKLTSESKPMDPEIADALTTEALWDLYETPAAPAAPEVQRDAVIAAVTEALGNAYDCQRVWEAWSVGTMGQDDFALVAEDPDRVAEIADAAIEAMRSASPPAPEVGEVVDLEANFRAWYQDAHGSAYFGATPLCVAIGWGQHLLSQQATPAPAVVPLIPHTERLRIMAAGIRYGYMAGHNDTVEASYGDPDEVAADYAPEILGELGDAPAPAVVPVAWGNFREDGICVGLSQHPEDIARWQNPRPLFLAAPVPAPVAVGERPWEREGWCDAEGRCWLRQGPQSTTWRLVKHGENGWDFTSYPRAILLPFHAIPLPQDWEGEG